MDATGTDAGTDENGITYNRDAQYNEQITITDEEVVAEALERLLNGFDAEDVVTVIRVCIGRKQAGNAAVLAEGSYQETGSLSSVSVISGIAPNMYTGQDIVNTFEFLEQQFDIVWDFSCREYTKNETPEMTCTQITFQVAKDKESLETIKFPLEDPNTVGRALSYPEPDLLGNQSTGLFEPIKRGYYKTVVPYERGVPIQNRSPYRFALYTPDCSREAYERYFDRNMSLFNVYLELSSIYGGEYLKTVNYRNTEPFWSSFWRAYFTLKAHLFGTAYTQSLVERVREKVTEVATRLKP